MAHRNAANSQFALRATAGGFDLNDKETTDLATPSAQIPSEFTNPNLEVLLSQEQIQTRIKELGAEITREYAGLNPLLIGVLKGACFFLSDLLRAIDTRLSIEFMAISSYGSSTRTSGEVRIMKDLDVPIEGRHILVVEDIVDTGLTLSYLLANLESRGAASVKLAALLDKFERREKDVKIDYLGFQIPDALCRRLWPGFRGALSQPAVHRRVEKSGSSVVSGSARLLRSRNQREQLTLC